MTSPAQGSFVVQQEPDRLERRKLAVVTAMSVVIFATATAVAWWLLVATSLAGATRGAPPSPAPPQIGTVETTLIETTARGLRLRSEQKKALEHYSWIDRDAGIARIPIERAMDVVADHPIPADRTGGP